MSGQKRGRKPRGRGGSAVSSPRIPTQESPTSLRSTPVTFASPQVPHVRWSLPPESNAASPAASTNAAQESPRINTPITPTPLPSSTPTLSQQPYASAMAPSYSAPSALAGLTLPYAASAPTSSGPVLDTTGLLRMPVTSYTGAALLSNGQPLPTARVPGLDEDGDGDDELLPAMADDDYSAQLSWNSQSKDNLKVLMDNFNPEQYDRFEAYRRHALPKQAVRKVIQQVLGQQVSQPVAQIVAGFAKVFVGEIVEKARAVQARRGESGPLSPDHLREAYRMYQEESGRVGAARPMRAKRLFVR